MTGTELGARRRRWDGGEEMGRREAGRGGMRRKKAWVVEVERRTRGVTEPPDGPAPRQELTTAFVTKFGQETLKSSFSRRGRKSRMAWENFCFLETLVCKIDPSFWN